MVPRFRFRILATNVLVLLALAPIFAILNTIQATAVQPVPISTLTSAHSRILWLVKDIYSGTSSSIPWDLTVMNGMLYFVADDGSHGRELWKSDGTINGTTLVKDIFPGLFDLYYYPPGEFTVMNGMLYFVADDDSHGRELWKSDGTAAGTVLVKDIYSGAETSLLATLTVMSDTLYFRADDGSSGLELWKSDGTASGTVLIKDICPPGCTYGSVPEELTAVGDVLYFVADDGSHGIELWKSDGTTPGTLLVKDIYTGTYSSFPRQLTAMNDMLYFTAYEGLWKSDGTAAGTVRVSNIYMDYSTDYDGAFPFAVVMTGTLYFRANGGSGLELWKSDGTAAGTTLVKDIYSGTYGSKPNNLVVMNGILYFRADGGSGLELWRSDGTAAGTTLVKDIYSGTYGSTPKNLVVVGDTLYLTAYDGSTGRELWKSNGTEASTIRLRDIYPGIGDGLPYGFLTPVEGRLYFSANDPEHGAELWALQTAQPMYLPLVLHSN